MDEQATAEKKQDQLDQKYRKDILFSQRSKIKELVMMNESRNGIPKNKLTMLAMLQWVHKECQLRWADIDIEFILNVVKEIDGYENASR